MVRRYTPTPVDPSVVAQQLAVIGVSGAAGFVWWTQTVPAKRLEVSRSKKNGEIAELLDELTRVKREGMTPGSSEWVAVVVEAEGATADAAGAMGGVSVAAILARRAALAGRRLVGAGRGAALAAATARACASRSCWACSL